MLIEIKVSFSARSAVDVGNLFSWPIHVRV